MSKVKIQGNASGTGVLTVTAPNTSTDRTITLPDGDVTLGAATPSIDDNGDATAITINSSEQVGIGTTSPNETLRVGGTVKIAPTNQTGTLAFGGTDNSNVHVGIFRGDANSLSAGNSLNLAGYSSITFSASAALVGSQTERMRVTSDGLTFNGDTAAANALDDYEEGTCTIQYSDGTNVEGNTNNAVYTKVGRMVTVSGDINSSGVGSNLTQTAELKLTGFPFTFLKNGTFAFLTRNFDYLADSTAVGYHPTNQTYASIYSFTDHGTYRNSLVSDLHGSTNDMYFTVTYQAS